MLAVIDSGAFTYLFCAVIGVVSWFGWRFLMRERVRLAALNNYILTKYRLGQKVHLKRIAPDVVDIITRVEDSTDAFRRRAELDGLWKRAVRLEGSVEFWRDLLQKLGLLGTVLGLGFALALQNEAVSDLLQPLSMAVWTTVAGLVASIAISWRFGRDIDVEVDAHEQNLSEWSAALDKRGSGGDRAHDHDNDRDDVDGEAARGSAS